MCPQTNSPYCCSPIVLLIWLSFLTTIEFAAVISFALGRTGLRRQNTHFATLMSTSRLLSIGPGKFLSECVCVIWGWGGFRIGQIDKLVKRKKERTRPPTANRGRYLRYPKPDLRAWFGRRDTWWMTGIQRPESCLVI